MNPGLCTLQSHRVRATPRFFSHGITAQRGTASFPSWRRASRPPGIHQGTRGTARPLALFRVEGVSAPAWHAPRVGTSARSSSRPAWSPMTSPPGPFVTVGVTTTGSPSRKNRGYERGYDDPAQPIPTCPNPSSGFRGPWRRESPRLAKLARRCGALAGERNGGQGENTGIFRSHYGSPVGLILPVSNAITGTLVSSRHVAATCGLLRGVSDNLGDSDRASAVAWQEDAPSLTVHALPR
jgi:hypothetical protein